MKEFIKTYGPFQNVRYVGFQGDLRSWYQDYDAVGVLMSLSEGAGRTTPEMMSFGFPMITSPDATCDIVKDGETAISLNQTMKKDWLNDSDGLQKIGIGFMQ